MGLVDSQNPDTVEIMIAAGVAASNLKSMAANLDSKEKQPLPLNSRMNWESTTQHIAPPPQIIAAPPASNTDLDTILRAFLASKEETQKLLIHFGSRLNDIEPRVNKVETDISDLNSHVDSKLNERDTWLTGIVTVETDISDLNSHVDSKLKERDTRLTGIVTNADSLKTRIVDLETTSNFHNNRINTQTTRIGNIDNAHRVQVNKQEDDVKELRELIAESTSGHNLNHTDLSGYVGNDWRAYIGSEFSSNQPLSICHSCRIGRVSLCI